MQRALSEHSSLVDENEHTSWQGQESAYLMAGKPQDARQAKPRALDSR